MVGFSTVHSKSVVELYRSAWSEGENGEFLISRLKNSFDGNSIIATHFEALSLLGSDLPPVLGPVPLRVVTGF